MWFHGQVPLNEFYHLKNKLYPSVKFTVKLEGLEGFPLDVFVSRRSNGTWGHTVFSKSTHTNIYLNAKSCHHHAQKWAVRSTLVGPQSILYVVSDTDSLQVELNFLE